MLIPVALRQTARLMSGEMAARRAIGIREREGKCLLIWARLPSGSRKPEAIR